MLIRITDTFISLFAIILLLPFLVIIAIILLLTGEHKIFYLQERIGYKKQKFKIIKFATMLSNSPNIGSGSLTLTNDPRVLPFGKYLRKTKINELPQLINVLTGDLSLVGPRPQMEIDFLKYSEIVQDNIYNIKPGITGIGSIIFRDEESLISNSTIKDPHMFYKSVIAPYKGELELWYQKKQSYINYIKIIVLTIFIVINPNNKTYLRWFPDIPLRKF